MGNEKEEKITTITIYAPQQVADDLEKLADAEKRSRSNYILILLEEHLSNTKKAK